MGHLRDNGFEVKTVDIPDLTPVKAKYGVSPQHQGCHTATVDGYVIEGHVPAREIYRLLEARPDAIGLSVPAMPRGSPGMDGPQYGGVVDPYDVLLIGRDGGATVFQSYR